MDQPKRKKLGVEKLRAKRLKNLTVDAAMCKDWGADNSCCSGSGLKTSGPGRVVTFRPVESSNYMRMMSNGD